MSSHQAPGWYGKISAQGDFASRRLPHDWVRACDEWLSECVAASRQQLGERWLEVYLGAPVWRFAWGPGVAGAHWWFGVLMPSCDNVGRYFPLVVAHARVHPPADRAGLDHLDRWWTHVAQAALGTLGEAATLDDFEAALQQSPGWPGTTPVAPPQLGPGQRWRHEIAPGATLADLAQALAATGLHERLVSASFWWPLAADGSPGSYTLLAGLPQPQSFAAMLGGAW